MDCGSQFSKRLRNTFALPPLRAAPQWVALLLAASWGCSAASADINVDSGAPLNDSSFADQPRTDTWGIPACAGLDSPFLDARCLVALNEACRTHNSETKCSEQ